MASYYIATTGNDTTGAGTLASPWLTYAKFYASSTTGDTCYAAAGTYTYEAMNINSRFLVGAALSGGFPTTIFDGGGSTFAQTTLGGTSGTSNIWFRNFSSNSNGSGGCFVYGASAQPTVHTFTNCVFNDINFAQVNGGGLFDSPYDRLSTTATFIGCLVFDITSTGSANDSAVFRLSAQSYAGTFTLKNCTVRLNYASPSLPLIFAAQDIKSQWYLYNNIFVDYGSATPTFGLVANRIAGAANNIVYGFSSVPTMTGTISSDPLFVDASADDFRLQADSPAVFAGVLI